jgi:6-phospho-beta-glucosidase
MKKFPANFLWGAAMSAPQTEGHSLRHGKSASTWDYWFTIAPEKFHAGQGPGQTSNVYDMYEADCARMQAIGLNSIRTSIAWTRLLPDGKTVNEAAVAFYRSYFKAMRAHGVMPIINLFHFDMPMWLMQQGGFEARAAVDAFAFYAETAFELFGDLVNKWTTFNEPMVHVECGYLYQYHYPAIVDFKKAVQVAYHTLMAHVVAVRALRRVDATAQIGILLNVSPAYAKSERAEDLRAKEVYELLNTRGWLDALVKGVVPQELIALLREHELLPTTEAGDLALIAEHRVDFIGLNYYQPRRVQAPKEKVTHVQMPEDLYIPYDWPHKRINPYRGWEIFPEALLDVAYMIRDEYGNIPWFVSENGMGVADEERFIDDDGVVVDEYRIQFMKEHLSVLHAGIQAGSNCFGYHTWTFIDCWSWLNGYRNRYGLYRVDLANNLTRTVKKSGLWFKVLTQNNGFDPRL